MTEEPQANDRARTRDILSAAMDLAPGQRRAYVEARMSSGATLEDALSLLGEVEGLGDFLESPSVSLPFQPALPERVGPFQVERVLGWGSMGVVYQGRQASPARTVAIKVLRLDTGSAVMARRFAQEGDVLARLAHPGVAAVYQAGTTDLGAGAQPYLAMEFVDGRPITQYAQENDLSVEARVRLVVALCHAVQHAHEQGILHRDLKPDNVLVRPNGEPCVLDFGVAHMASADPDHLTMTMTGQVIGTLAYMAPEQARGATLDVRADLFALGAILYELLTGQLPFDVRGKLPHESLRIIADGECRPPTVFLQGMDGDLEAVLLTALAPEPVRRFADVRLFAEDLERFLDGDAVLARPPSSTQSLLRFVRRNAALSAVLLVSLFAMGAIFAWGASAFIDAQRAQGGAALFADARLMESLEAESDSLWPTSTATVAQFDSWLARARGIQTRLPAHRAAVESMGATPPSPLDGAESMDVLYLRAAGGDVLPALEGLMTRLLLEMEARAGLARESRQVTIGDRRLDWETAASRVAADGRFSRFQLEPQEGLVPLGPDPVSGLEEFAVWLSGEIPKRDPQTGLFEALAPDALVLVMVPGGRRWVGAQREDPQSPNFDARAAYDPEPNGCEGPAIELELDPFLLSKFEMTQAQWIRLAGSNPSDWEVGAVFAGQTVGLTNPVETLSWKQALIYLRHWELSLPTEAQWEFAAGADNPRTYQIGDTPLTLAGYSNWSTHQMSAEEAAEFGPDPYETHRPIGQLLPNAYGFYDMMGNVWEYCLDVYKVRYHFLPHRAGDGLVLSDRDGDVSRRGFSSGDGPRHQRLWGRATRRFDAGDALTGIRPSRLLVPVEPEK